MRCAQTSRASHAQRPAAGEREGRGGDVVLGHGLQHVARVRAPHADHAERVGLVAQLDGVVARAHVQAQPAEVGVDRRRAGDDAEALLAEARDGDVGHDAAALVQELRVDDAPRAAVDVRVADALEQRGRPGPSTAILPNDVMSISPTRSRSAADSSASTAE